MVKKFLNNSVGPVFEATTVQGRPDATIKSLLRRAAPLNLLAAVCLAAAFLLLVPAPSFSLTVQEVASELECPCDCPLVLEDCNMSCGLDWKDQIGEQIRAGKTKEEIIGSFIDRYGDACRITPVKRIRGKLYQYTRGFDTVDWAILYGGAALWVLAVFFAIFLVVRRVSGKKGGGEGQVH